MPSAFWKIACVQELLIKSGNATPIPEVLWDTTLATTQAAGLEALSSDDETRKENILRGSIGSAGATLLDELPWQRLNRRRIAYFYY